MLRQPSLGSEEKDAMPIEADPLPGILDGTVADEKGATLPGAVLTLLGGPFPEVQVSNALGEFKFLKLQAATYNLQTELEGFTTVDDPDVVINSGKTTNLDVTLSVA
jgi:hypothetical protein